MLRALSSPSFLSLLLCGTAAGHGALVDPLSRNAVDRSLPWDERTPHVPCICANASAGSMPGDKGGCDNAQACFWYSQGCFIGCPTCDSKSGRAQYDLCGLGKKATINDPALRSVNRAAEAGSELDIYKHNPWRAPGTAPVVDACGLAGGTPWGGAASEWGWYVNTTYAKHGDRGSEVLPRLPTSTVWKRGGEAEVIWQTTANHGGGYSYRLCPASEPLTEECFAKHPLDFVPRQSLQWPNGSRTPINGVFVSQGTYPARSTWALNPIPPRCLGGCDSGNCCNSTNVCTPCGNSAGHIVKPDCTSCDNTPEPSFEPPCDEAGKPGLCSGNQPSKWGSVAVVDVLVVPSDLPAGEYVLGWRLDCEATAQVWSNCADLTLA